MLSDERHCSCLEVCQVLICNLVAWKTTLLQDKRSGLELGFLFLGGALKPLGKVTKGHQGQLVVKNALQVDNGLRASRPNPKKGRPWPQWPWCNLSPANGIRNICTLTISVAVSPKPLPTLLGFGLDALRPLPAFRAFFTTIWPCSLFVTFPRDLSPPIKNTKQNLKP